MVTAHCRFLFVGLNPQFFLLWESQTANWNVCFLSGYSKWGHPLMKWSLMKAAPGLRIWMNAVFIKVIVKLAFTCKIYEVCKDLITYKLTLREPSLTNTILRPFNEGCYLVFKVNFCGMGICYTRLKFVYKISKQ